MILLRPLPKSEVRRVAVVGGAGYLGSTLCEQLVNLGFEVASIDAHWFRDESPRHLPNHPAFTSYKIDVRHVDKLLPLLRGYDAVFGLAGLVGDPACKIDTEFTYSCNYLATLTLANMCKRLGIRRFVFASSCSVYGRSDNGAQQFTEESAPCPLSYYAQDKLDCEEAIRMLADDSFHPTILRLSTLFGWSSRMRFDLVVNLLTAQACVGQTLKIHGGTQWRPFLHVRDAADAFAAVVMADAPLVSNRVFNIGSDANNYQVVDVAHMISTAIPATRIEVLSDTVDRRDYRVDFSRIKRTIGYEPKLSVADGIAEIQHMFKQLYIKDITHPMYVNETRTRQIISETWRRRCSAPIEPRKARVGS
jgi:nucleoside-diphosphate-sugar epimerase